MKYKLNTLILHSVRVKKAALSLQEKLPVQSILGLDIALSEESKRIQGSAFLLVDSRFLLVDFGYILLESGYILVDSGFLLVDFGFLLVDSEYILPYIVCLRKNINPTKIYVK